MPSNVYKECFKIQLAPDYAQVQPDAIRLSDELARRYANNELVTEQMLRAGGEHLWRSLNLEDEFDKARRAAGQGALAVVIESDEPALLRLPWEALHHPEYGFLGLSGKFTLSRRITGAAGAEYPLQPGPLKVLLFTAMTEDQARLDVEEEQAQVQEALMGLEAEGKVVLEMPDDGRFETFKHLLRDFQPQLVFLSGHGKFHDRSALGEDDYAEFLFETNRDDGDPIAGARLADAFGSLPVQCVVLSACESGKSASDRLNSGLAQRLAVHGIPHVVGMRESILDLGGTRFNRVFCDALARQERVDVAVQQARAAISEPLTGVQKDLDQTGAAKLSRGQWCLPALLSADPARPLIDWVFQSTPPSHIVDKRSLDAVTLPARFIGRRRELRRLSRDVLEYRLNRLLITGPGGQGKTALAGRLAQKLQRQGCRVLAWSAREKADWSGFKSRLEQSLNADESDRYDRQLARCEDEAAKIELLIELAAAQSANPLVLLFDNLESVQDPDSREITDPATQQWITTASNSAGAGLTVLLTSRWQLPGWTDEQHWPLEHLSYNDYLALARQQRLPTALLGDRDRLKKLHETLHGNARGLGFFVAAVQGMLLQQEDQFLEKLAQATAEVQTDMALDQVVQHRSAAEQELLLRMTAYQVPVPVEGVIKLALDADQPQTLLDNLIAVSLVERHDNVVWQCREYQVPATVVDWLHRHGQTTEQQYIQSAAEYLWYLFRRERGTLDQAITAHQALRIAGEHQSADRLVLDIIVGRLSLQGLYRTVLDDWLPQVCESSVDQVRGEALGQTGKQYWHIGDYETALNYLESSLKISQEIGDKLGEGATLNNISQIYKARGDYETALSYLESSLKIRQEIGDTAGLCATLFNMGHILLQNEKPQEALAAWLTVYRIAKPIQLAQVLDALAGLAEQLGLEGGLDAWQRLADKADSKPPPE